eukprot:51328-Pelagomonas_calceolata.AAC.1
MQARNAVAAVYNWLLPVLISGTLANVSKSLFVRKNGRYCSKLTTGSARAPQSRATCVLSSTSY